MYFSIDSVVLQKEENSLQIIVHPDSVFTVVVNGEAFVLLEKQIEYCLEMQSIYVSSFFACGAIISFQR